MTNLVANLYEDNRGRFFKLIETDEEYCEEQDNEDTHEQIQKIYEKLEFTKHRTKVYRLCMGR